MPGLLLLISAASLVETTPVSPTSTWVVQGDCSESPSLIVVYNSESNAFGVGTRYTGYLEPHVNRMGEGGHVYLLRDVLGKEVAAVLRNGRMDGTWICTCVGTGGNPNVCPGLPNCPPTDCSNYTGGRASCKLVKHANP